VTGASSRFVSARREHRRFHQVGRAELVRRAGTPQRREQIEPARLKTLSSDTAGKREVSEVRRAEKPTDQRQRVQVGRFRRHCATIEST
jgi:hypothetical protein